MTVWAAHYQRSALPSPVYLLLVSLEGFIHSVRKIFNYFDKIGVGLHVLASWAVAVLSLVLNKAMHNIASLPCS